jgi:hypothetical protein
MTTRRVTLAAALGVCAIGLSGCASGRGLDGARSQTRDGTIATYLGPDNKCHTITTPRVPLSRGRRDVMRWKVKDDAKCRVDVEIRFDKGDASPFDTTCRLRHRGEIKCRVRADAEVKTTRYSVWIGDQVEDPELEIEM